MGAQHLTNDEKARLYNDLLFRYQRLSEEVRQIKSKNFEVSLEDQKKINSIELTMKKIYADTQKLYS